MIRVHALLCAEGTVIDRRTSNLSIFNIIAGIHSARFPLLYPKIMVVAMLSRDAGDATPTAVLKISQDGKNVFRQPLPLEFQDKLRARVICDVRGLNIAAPCDLTFDLILDGRRKARHVIRVSSSEPVLKVQATTTKGSGDDRTQAKPKRKPKKKKRKAAR